MDDLVTIAAIVRPRGIRGEVFAEVLTDFPERFDGLQDVTAITADSARLGLKIENAWFQQGRVVLKFAGYDSVEAAESLRGCKICIPESEAVELEADEYFDWQLEGCRIETVDGKTIGTVIEVQRTGGTENLLVSGDGKDHLIPFAGSICVEVDIENKLIKVDLPDGLLDF